MDNQCTNVLTALFDSGVLELDKYFNEFEQIHYTRICKLSYKNVVDFTLDEKLIGTVHKTDRDVSVRVFKDSTLQMSLYEHAYQSNMFVCQVSCSTGQFIKQDRNAQALLRKCFKSYN